MLRVARPRFALVAIAVLAAAATACGGADESSSEASTGGTTAPAGPGTTAGTSNPSTTAAPAGQFTGTDECKAMRKWSYLPTKLKTASPDEQSTLYGEMINLANELKASQPQFASQFDLMTQNAKAMNVDGVKLSPAELDQHRQANADIWNWYKTTCFE